MTRKISLFLAALTVACIHNTQAQIVEGPALVPFHRTVPAGRVPDSAEVDKKQDVAYFIQQAFMDNKVEIQKGALAATRASGQTVKDLALTLVKDHTELTGQVNHLAGKEYTVVSESLDAQQLAKMDELTGLSGVAFDKAFLSDQMNERAKTIAIYEKTAAECDNAAVKKFAEATLPMLRKNLETARLSGQP